MKDYNSYLKNLILQKVVKQQKIIKLNAVITHFYFQYVWIMMSNISTSSGLISIVIEAFRTLFLTNFKKKKKNTNLTSNKPKTF